MAGKTSKKTDAKIRALMRKIGKAAREAAHVLALAPTAAKNKALTESAATS